MYFYDKRQAFLICLFLFRLELNLQSKQSFTAKVIWLTVSSRFI